MLTVRSEIGPYCGYKDSAQVRKHGIRLRPEFYHRLNPMTQREAVWTEKKLAVELRS
jgi:hypothetical protein